MSCLIARAAATVVPPPNIVFVLFDDLGYGEPACYRSDSPFRTPHLDRLAAGGMRFTDAHSAASNCTPTRYGVLTGRHPMRIGRFRVLNTYSKPIIPESRLTVAAFLRQNGYHTACIGKWHLGLKWVGGKPGPADKLHLGARLTGGPNALGFDYFYGYADAKSLGSILEQDQVVAHVDAVENQLLMIRKAVDYIETRSGGESPFFLYFPMCPPHKPHVPAPDFVGKSGIQGKESNYGDWIYQGDDMLGQIVEALERTDQADETLIIITGDNGASRRVYPPLRAAKSSIYEGGHREPFIAYWPGRIQPGAVCHAPVSLNDLFATCADLVGESLPEDAAEDSFSLLPHLFQEPAAPARQVLIQQSPQGELAIRHGPWKLIFLGDDRRELYYLETDIGETVDVADANAAVVAQLTRLMEDAVDRGRITPGPRQLNDFDVRSRLGVSSANAPPGRTADGRKDTE